MGTPGRPPILPDAYELKNIHSAGGVTYAQMAEYFSRETGEKITEQAVQWRLASIGYMPKAEGRAKYKFIPYDIQPGDGQARQAQLLRCHMRDMDGEDVSGTKLGRELPGFRRRLRHSVLVYDATWKWRFVRREPSDEDLVIRWPEGLDKPSEEFLKLFRLPPEADDQES
ncbi:hypothetical protein ACFY1P_08225 [Streptomyces sp. NPDC001407]|uniref:hypothetical protein n=1 Tax=Streptomyces sp. NPDC001407 TaxID=3364573 RepID=UPI0036B4742B